MSLIFYGMLIGWGASIPFGPINVEMSRRNLHFGTLQGMALGLGACLADLTYLILLRFGALELINHPEILRDIGIIGSLVLGWFGISALLAKNTAKSSEIHKRSLLHGVLSGLFLTLLNPYTILFWSSILTQVALLSESGEYSFLMAGGGVLLAAFSWVLFINLLLHFTRHKLPVRVTSSLNKVGGVILVGFSIFGLIHAFQIG